MGSGESKLRRSATYGSSRSVAFSLPSRLETRAYSNGTAIRPSSVAASSPKTYPRPILRNSSVTDIAMNLSTGGSSSGIAYQTKANSYHSLYEMSRTSEPRQPNRFSDRQLTPRQYNDIYLKNDLKRVFRAHDKSQAVALIDDFNESSTTSLDRRLYVLKKQRSQSDFRLSDGTSTEQKRESATEKKIKSRKSKKAPLPSANTNNNNLMNQKQSLFRKKTPAPQPPLKEKSKSMPSLHAQDLSKSASFENHIKIPYPDYEMPSAVLALKKASEQLKLASLKVREPAEANSRYLSNTSLQKKAKAPGVPDVDHKQSVSTIITSWHGAESSVTKPVSIRQSVLSLANVVVASVDVHNVEDNTYKQETNPSMAEGSVQDHIDAPYVVHASVPNNVKEIAVQHNSPVEIAIQCSGNTLKYRSKPPQQPTVPLNDVLRMLSATKPSLVNKSSNTQSSYHADTDSVGSEENSKNTRGKHKVMLMTDVLAGIPEPPPPPNSDVRLLTKRTIQDDVPVTLAPPSSTSSVSDTGTKSLSSFEEELLKAYAEIKVKKANGLHQPETTSKLVRQDSSSSSEASSKPVYQKHRNRTSLLTTPESEFDSGHDEPSEHSSPLPDNKVLSSIPDFVLEELSHNWPKSGLNTSWESPVARRDRAKFNSLRRFSKSLRSLMSALSKGSANNQSGFEDIPVLSDENWTFSGKSRNSRPALPMSELKDHKSNSITSLSNEFPNNMSNANANGTGQSPPEEMNGSSGSFKSSSKNFISPAMNSLSLLTPLGYNSPKQYAAMSLLQPAVLHGDESVADVQL